MSIIHFAGSVIPDWAKGGRHRSRTETYTCADERVHYKLIGLFNSQRPINLSYLYLISFHSPVLSTWCFTRPYIVSRFAFNSHWNGTNIVDQLLHHNKISFTAGNLNIFSLMEKRNPNAYLHILFNYHVLINRLTSLTMFVHNLHKFLQYLRNFEYSLL